MAHKSVADDKLLQEGPVCLVLDSPWGDLVIRGSNSHIRSIRFQSGVVAYNARQASWYQACTEQLSRYCQGEALVFDLPLQPLGSAFQQRVWQQLQQLRFGQLGSYREIAQRLGNTAAVRAVASANARNPISIVIPCHRVIGSDRALRGYAGGLEIKAALLRHEGCQLQDGVINERTRVQLNAESGQQNLRFTAN